MLDRVSFISAILNQPVFWGSRMLIQYCVIVSDNHAISDMMQMILRCPLSGKIVPIFRVKRKYMKRKDVVLQFLNRDINIMTGK